MREFLLLLKMDLQNLFRNPVLVGFNTLFSGLMTAILGFLMSGNYADIRDAFQYYAVTLTIFAMLNGAMTASNCFMERDIRKPNLRIIFSPVGGTAIWLSKLVASFLFDTALHFLMLVLFVPLFGITLGSNPLYFLLLMLPIEFAAAALGIFFCCILHSEETTSTVLSGFIQILAALGGTFFSLDGLGKIASRISLFSPVKWINDVFFSLSCDNDTSGFLPVFLGALILSILLLLGCRIFFRTEDYV